MRLEPLLTLEIRDNIRRAVNELNDIEEILESMRDFTQPTGYYQDVTHSQDTLIERMDCVTNSLFKSLLFMTRMRGLTNAECDMTLSDLEKLHQP